MDQTLAFIKQHWLKLITGTVLVILISAIAILSVITFRQNKRIIYLDNSVNAKNTELAEIKSLLSKTEEGRKQLEGIKVSLEQDKTKLTEDNSKLNEKANAIQADLDAKQASLAQATNDLAAKQSALTKAQRGIALFDSVKTQFDQYNVNLQKAGENILNAIAAENMGDDASAQNYINQAQSYSSKSTANYNQIISILNKIKSGNY